MSDHYDESAEKKRKASIRSSIEIENASTKGLSSTSSIAVLDTPAIDYEELVKKLPKMNFAAVVAGEIEPEPIDNGEKEEADDQESHASSKSSHSALSPAVSSPRASESSDNAPSDINDQNVDSTNIVKEGLDGSSKSSLQGSSHEKTDGEGASESLDDSESNRSFLPAEPGPSAVIPAFSYAAAVYSAYVPEQEGGENANDNSQAAQEEEADEKKSVATAITITCPSSPSLPSATPSVKSMSVKESVGRASLTSGYESDRTAPLSISSQRSTISGGIIGEDASSDSFHSVKQGTSSNLVSPQSVTEENDMADEAPQSPAETHSDVASIDSDNPLSPVEKSESESSGASGKPTASVLEDDRIAFSGNEADDDTSGADSDEPPSSITTIQSIPSSNVIEISEASEQGSISPNAAIAIEVIQEEERLGTETSSDTSIASKVSQEEEHSVIGNTQEKKHLGAEMSNASNASQNVFADATGMSDAARQSSTTSLNATSSVKTATASLNSGKQLTAAAGTDNVESLNDPATLSDSALSSVISLKSPVLNSVNSLNGSVLNSRTSLNQSVLHSDASLKDPVILSSAEILERVSIPSDVADSDEQGHSSRGRALDLNEAGKRQQKEFFLISSIRSIRKSVSEVFSSTTSLKRAGKISNNNTQDSNLHHAVEINDDNAMDDDEVKEDDSIDLEMSLDEKGMLSEVEIIRDIMIMEQRSDSTAPKTVSTMSQQSADSLKSGTFTHQSEQTSNSSIPSCKSEQVAASETRPDQGEQMSSSSVAAPQQQDVNLAKSNDSARANEASPSVAITQSQAGANAVTAASDHGMHLTWYRVKCISQDGKQILRSISGEAKPGELIAIMGETGSGKTTLLNVLAGRVSGGTVTGDIRANGSRRTPNWERITGFVETEDTLYPHLTVQETIAFAAMLKLPSSMTSDEKHAQVQSVMHELDLGQIAYKKVGNPGDHFGISKDARKRVSLAIELVARPSLLFLDEPTNQSDSHNATSMITALRRWAEKNSATVILTIKQPRLEILRQFSTILLMSAGRTVFFGTLSGAIYHFAKWGFSVPKQDNPIDFFLDTIAFDDRTPQLKEKSERRLKVFWKAWMLIERRLLAKSNIIPAINPTEYEDAQCLEQDRRARFSKDKLSWPNSLTKEFSHLWLRNMKGIVRSKAQIPLIVFQCFALTMLAGFAAFRSGHHFAGVQDRQGVMLFIIINIMGGIILPLVYSFETDRKVISKERKSATFRVSACILAKFCAEILFQVLIRTISAIALYYIIGFRTDDMKYILIYLSITVLTTICSVSLGLAVVSTAKNYRMAEFFFIFVLTTSVLFAGSLVNFSSITRILRWISYTSVGFYAFQAFIQNELHGQVFAHRRGTFFLHIFGQNEMPYYGSVIALAALPIIFLVWAMIALHLRTRSKLLLV